MNGPIIKLAIENRKELFSDDLLNYTLEKKKTGQLDLWSLAPGIWKTPHMNTYMDTNNRKSSISEA